MNEAALARFGAEYARHREIEGRNHVGNELLSLPYLASGPLARQWAVRARSFEAFVEKVLHPHAARLGRPLRLLDLGAGNGWLSYRVAQQGHRAVALDIRADAVDGLGAATAFVERAYGRIETIVASFDEIPLPPSTIDIAVFNASLHYATDLAKVVREAARLLRPEGQIVILDSPFYRSEADGAAMVAEKKGNAPRCFGSRAGALLALPFIEYLTPERLREASAPVGLRWRRHRVLYPLWYELRPIVARARGRRVPSRFDLWVGDLR